MMLAFAVLMDVALIGMDLSMAARGLPGGGQRIPMFAAVAAVSLAVLWGIMQRVREPGSEATEEMSCPR